MYFIFDTLMSKESETYENPGTPNTPPPFGVGEKAFSPKSPSMSPPKNVPLPSSSDSKSSRNEEKRNPKKDFETMVDFYLANNPYLKTNGKESELEIRFGTNRKLGKPLSKIEYDNIIKQFYIAGFQTEEPEGMHMLRISNQFTNQDGRVVMSRIRAEIAGMDLIEEYCRTNSLPKILEMPSTSTAQGDKIKFTKKEFPLVGGRENGKHLQPVDFEDFNFRVSYQHETDISVRENIARRILATWNDSKKTFRYINRVRFAHPDFPVFLDVSIVKNSAKVNGRVSIPQYTIQEAKLFDSPEEYEVELEIDNARVGPGTNYSKVAPLLKDIRKTIRIVLSGMQGTSYPISFSERDTIHQHYMLLLHGEDYVKDLLNNENKFKKRILPRDFVGPSSNTLQLENIQPVNPDDEITTTVPNIRDNYTVTDKADGERRLLYVSPSGRLYMIDSNMNVLFTGTFTNNKEHYNTLIDGEYIQYNKLGEQIHLYAAFDIYYLHGKSVREYLFLPPNTDEEVSKYRYPVLSSFIRELKPINIMNDHGGNSEPDKKEKTDKPTVPCSFQVKVKDFYRSEDGSIFHGCKTILQKEKDNLFEYIIDGLIFTPSYVGVGGSNGQKVGPLHKSTWDLSFKWKPPKYNTIDFLVSVKKDKTGKDEVHSVFQEGMDLAGGKNIVQYKTLILQCGFDLKKDGYINPCLDVINDDLPSYQEDYKRDNYIPVPFQPTNPYVPDAYYCNVVLTNNGDGGQVLMTQEKEYFEEDMIVEFSYNKDKHGYWKWEPLRVRYDKTNELRSGTSKNYGNAFRVANSNWHSIHHPITDEMISSGLNIPEVEIDDSDVYYNRVGSRNTTQSLRDFHNLYVKKKLIGGVAHRDDILIDYAVGKGGDFSKWIHAKLKFVFGIDVSKDNIENKKDGACARYLNNRKKYRNVPGALFVTGNSGLPIRSGKAFPSEKDKQIVKAIFGQGPKDRNELGEGVYKRYGIGEEGFQISSCQFAMHYFFESENTMHTFFQNVAECTRINGYFIGTCYDGQSVFELLAKKNKSESFTVYREDDKMAEIIKQYDHTSFSENETSLGYAIDVYQESINKVFREYLVNFQYLVRVMENYGFVLATPEEAKSFDLPNGSGLFSELYTSMNEELSRDKRLHNAYGTAPALSKEEKQISFLNRYFIFRKTHHVNAEKVGRLMKSKIEEEEEEDAEKIVDARETEEKPEEKPKKHIIKRIKKKGVEKITIK